MKQSLLRGLAMQWWSSETVGCSPSLQLDVTTGYIMGINTACGHITWHTNSWQKRQRQPLKCWTGWLLKTSLNLFLDGSSRHIYEYIYFLLETNNGRVCSSLYKQFVLNFNEICSQWISFSIIYFCSQNMKKSGGGGGRGKQNSFQSFLWYYSIGFRWWCITSEFNDFNYFSHRTHQNLKHYYVLGSGSTPVFRLGVFKTNVQCK